MDIAEDYSENYQTGWIKIFRSIRNHWIWDDPVKFQRWVDILLEVNHSGKTVNIGYKKFECNKGECLVSLESWGKRWNVSKTVVNNFFRLLQSDGMIEVKNETVTTRLIVCNYDTYQQNQNAIKTQQSSNSTATVPRQSTTKNYKNEKKFIYSEFYDLELETSNNDSNYKNFIEFIHGASELGRLNGVLSIPEQLTFEEFEKILLRCSENKKNLRDILTKIENTKKYYKDKKNLYRTLLNWTEDRFIK